MGQGIREDLGTNLGSYDIGLSSKIVEFNEILSQ